MTDNFLPRRRARPKRGGSSAAIEPPARPAGLPASLQELRDDVVLNDPEE